MAHPLHRPGLDDVDDWEELGDLVTFTVDRLTRPVEGMHRAIAGRWLDVLQLDRTPIGGAADAATAAVYRSVRLGGRVVGTLIGLSARLVSLRRPVGSVWRSPAGTRVKAGFNATWGDELESRSNRARTTMTLRSFTGEIVDLDHLSLSAAYPDPESSLVVLLHGLGETERCWHASVPDEEGGGLSTALRRASHSVLLIRYNSGRSIEHNGRELSRMVEQIVECWPTEVERIALVGSSMGGLVARSAVLDARGHGHHWIDDLRHVVTLGTPHLGAPLEKFAHFVASGLRLSSTTAPLGEFIDTRSAGIQDLRHGRVGHGDLGADPDGQPSPDVPAESGIERHFLAGTVTSNPEHPLGVVVGDLIVRPASGTGRGSRRVVEADHVRVVGGRTHFDLLRDTAVHREVVAWLDE